jgi:hypothetical protein
MAECILSAGVGDMSTKIVTVVDRPSVVAFLPMTLY